MHALISIISFVLHSASVYGSVLSHEYDEVKKGENHLTHVTTESTEEYESTSTDHAVASAESVVHNMDSFFVDLHKSVFLIRELGIQGTMGAAMTHLLNSYVDLVQLSLKHLVTIRASEIATDDAISVILSEMHRITVPGFKSTSGEQSSELSGIVSTQSHKVSNGHGHGTASTTTTTEEESVEETILGEKGGLSTAATSEENTSDIEGSSMISSNHDRKSFHSGTSKSTNGSHSPSYSKKSSGFAAAIAGAVNQGVGLAKGLNLNIEKTTEHTSESTHHASYGTTDQSAGSHHSAYTQPSYYAHSGDASVQQPTYGYYDQSGGASGGYASGGYGQSGGASGGYASGGYSQSAGASTGYASGSANYESSGHSSSYASSPSSSSSTKKSSYSISLS